MVLVLTHHMLTLHAFATLRLRQFLGRPLCKRKRRATQQSDGNNHEIFHFNLPLPFYTIYFKIPMRYDGFITFKQ
jgi:hypothetical protein